MLFGKELARTTGAEECLFKETTGATTDPPPPELPIPREFPLTVDAELLVEDLYSSAAGCLEGRE